MRFGHRTRKIFRGLVALIFSVLILLALAPVWTPWILRPVLRHFGVQYSAYERKGYSRFVLLEVRFELSGTKFNAKKVEAFVPTVWLWEKFFTSGKNVFVSVGDWRLIPAITNAVADQQFYPSLAESERSLALLRKWLPRASLQNGSIDWKETPFAAPEMEWHDGFLTAQMSAARFPQTATAKLNLQKFPWTVSLKMVPAQVTAEFSLAPSTAGATLDGKIFWRSNVVNVSARFIPENFLPASARVEAKSFRVPAQTLNLAGYEDLSGSVLLNWTNDNFYLDLAASAQPLTERAPPVTANFHAHGDTNSVQVETAKISAPWLAAELSKGFEIAFTGQLISESAAFRVTSDLSKQPWLPLTGLLSGEAFFRRDEKNLPDIFFVLSGQKLRGYGIETAQLDIEGHLIWPALKINLFNLQLADGSRANAKAELDLQTRSIESANLQLAGNLGQKFLPPGLSYKSFSLDAQLSGPWKKPRHAAKAEIRNLTAPKFAPLNVSANWRGEFFSIQEFHVEIIPPGQSVLTLAGSAQLATNQFDIALSALNLDHAGEKISLDRPTKISGRQTKWENKNRWRFAMDSLRWRSGQGELVLTGSTDWPAEGKLTGSARNFSIAAFQDFFKGSMPDVDVTALNLSADWNHGPLNFSLAAATQFSPKQKTSLPNLDLPFSAQLQATGGVHGVSLEKFVASSRTAPVISGSGFLPLTIEPARGTNILRIEPKQPLQFRAVTQPNPNFWNALTAGTRLVLHEPLAQIAVSGTLDAPEGNVKVSLNGAEFQIATNRPVHLKNVSADIALARKQIALKEFRLLVENQPIIATGTLPLPEKLDRDWKKTVDWRKADANLKMKNVQLAAFVVFAPQFLAPQGTLNLDLAMRPGGNFSGELKVENAASRPLPQVGSMQNVEARLKFDGEKVELARGTGLLGGGPVVMFGYVDLFKHEPLTKLPFFDLTLRGDNVPLARKPELIARTALDLRASNLKGGQPLVSGTVTLEKSFFLSDLKLLVPERLAKPKNRPPYFSIETEPFADWRLDIKVSGNEFLKVRSPFFTGVASADLEVTGTAREPLALGTAKIDSGVVHFPFGNLRVNQGDVSLTRGNPFLPFLYVMASTRAFDYEIKMQVSGPADAPKLQFSSTPGLTSEQILVMLTTGELPQSGTTFSTQQRAGKLAMFVGQNLLSRLGFGDSSEERLTIRSGESFSEQGRQTYSIEYKFEDDWFVVGEYDRFGGFNIGLRWRFFSE